MNDTYLRAIQGLTGNKTEKDVKVAEVRNQFANDFDSSINVVYDALRNDVQQDFIIVPTKDKNKFTIFARPDDELNIGDIIYWNNLHWLVEDFAFDDEIYTTGTIIRCNRQIEWQNDDGDIISRWCSATKPSLVENQGNVVTVLNGKYNVKLPYDDDTVSVPIGKRFMLDIIGGRPICYHLEYSDINSDKYENIDGGCIEWSLVSDEYNKDVDNVEQMICNYTVPIAPVETVGLKLDIVGKQNIKSGYTNKYTARFYDSQSQLDNTVIPSWSVEFSNVKDSDYIHYSVIDHELSIKCDFVENVINHDFTVKLTDTNHAYSDSAMTVKVVSVYD